jgi:hypothetical protein
MNSSALSSCCSFSKSRPFIEGENENEDEED